MSQRPSGNTTAKQSIEPEPEERDKFLTQEMVFGIRLLRDEIDSCL